MTNYISFLMTETLNASFMSVSFSTYNPEANKKLQLFKITMSIASPFKNYLSLFLKVF